MRRFTKAIAVKRFALVAVVQDGDRKQFEVRVWKAEDQAPKPVGPPMKYVSDGFDANSAREVRRTAHGVANRLAAQFFQGLHTNVAEGEASPFAVQHMSAEWAEKLIQASAAEVEQAAAQALSLPDVEEPEPWPLSDAEEEALDAAAAAKAQSMSPKAQEAVARRRP
jgi:hypothetical protein